MYVDGFAQVTKLDPLSPLGYERKHEALRGLGHQDDATDTFKVMLLKTSKSLDLEIRGEDNHIARLFPGQYPSVERSRKPEETAKAIRTFIGATIHDSPLVLINTISGHLCDKSEQTAALEKMSAFRDLVSSMTTHIDHIHRAGSRTNFPTCYILAQMGGQRTSV